MIESINNQIKNVFQIEHTRHRSVVNGFSNIIAALIAFTHHDKKPKLNIDSIIDSNTGCQLSLAWQVPYPEFALEVLDPGLQAGLEFGRGADLFQAQASEGDLIA